MQELTAETTKYIHGLDDPHPFIERLLKAFGWQKRDFLDLVLRKHEKFMANLAGTASAPRSSCEPRIQRFSHKIWLTSDNEPHSPPEALLAPYFAMCKEHPPEWTHFFWTNSAYVLNQVSARALEDGAKVLALNIEGMVLGELETTVRRLITDRKFVLAADVLKFVILDRYGGIYSDLGVFFDESILEIASAADYTFLLASNVFFQTSWVSLAKGSLLSTAFLAVMNNPEILSVDYALDDSKTVNAGTEVHTFAGLGYTTCALLFMPETATCFAFPENLRQLKWRGQASWYGDAPKFGNALINQSVPSIFSQEKYATFASAAHARLRTINANGRLAEMARIIVNLSDYFQKNPTELCRCFAYSGSGDKVGGWHNYGYIYFFILGTFAHRGCKLLEVGDASSLWGEANAQNSDSSLGGSIRVWSEYWGAITFGAQIDRSLSRFSLDDNVLVNRAEHVAMRQQLTRYRYDVVIDNGVHRFEAAVMMLDAGVSCLASGGIYVVEAVPTSDIRRWEAHLTMTSRTAFIMNIPNALNNNDNCLVIVLNERADQQSPSRQLVADAELS